MNEKEQPGKGDFKEQTLEGKTVMVPGPIYDAMVKHLIQAPYAQVAGLVGAMSRSAILLDEKEAMGALGPLLQKMSEGSGQPDPGKLS
jgi:hypothetical protein